MQRAKEVIKVKTVLRWIVLCWSIVTIPVLLVEPDIYVAFFGLLYVGLVVGLMISDIRCTK